MQITMIWPWFDKCWGEVPDGGLLYVDCMS
jgi:hypothetical protein